MFTSSCFELPVADTLPPPDSASWPRHLARGNTHVRWRWPLAGHEKMGKLNQITDFEWFRSLWLHAASHPTSGLLGHLGCSMSRPPRSRSSDLQTSNPRGSPAYRCRWSPVSRDAPAGIWICGENIQWKSLESPKKDSRKSSTPLTIYKANSEVICRSWNGLLKHPESQLEKILSLRIGVHVH